MVPGGGYAPGLRNDGAPSGDITEAGAWHSERHTLNRAPNLFFAFSRSVQASASLSFQTPAGTRTAHSTARRKAVSVSDASLLLRAWSATQAMSRRPIPFPCQSRCTESSTMNSDETCNSADKTDRLVVGQRQPAQSAFGVVADAAQRK